MTAAAFLSHLAFVAGLFALSALLTRLMIRVNIQDVPNHRSSHVRPTPKSGGIAVAAAFFAGIVTLYALTDTVRLPEGSFLALVLLSGLLLGFAYLDDRYDVPALGKLAAQLGVAAGFALFVAAVEAPPAGFLLTVLWLVFFVNAFNFMDGINGLASGTAMVAAAFLAAVAFHDLAHFVYVACLCLIGALAGFFVFNFPRGRIFLGDTGSQTIGLLLAGLAVIGHDRDIGRMPFHAVPILFSAFLYDVLLTLAVRTLQRRNLLQAHRQHVYQLLIRMGWSHARVTGLYLALATLAGTGLLAVEIGGLVGPATLTAALLALYAAGTVPVYLAARRRGLLAEAAPAA